MTHNEISGASNRVDTVSIGAVDAGGVFNLTGHGLLR